MGPSSSDVDKRATVSLPALCLVLLAAGAMLGVGLFAVRALSLGPGLALAGEFASVGLAMAVVRWGLRWSAVSPDEPDSVSS